MKRRLKKLESRFGRGGERGTLCPDCGGLGLAEAFDALEVLDGPADGPPQEREAAEKLWAEQVWEEIEAQPERCSSCGELTFAGVAAALEDEEAHQGDRGGDRGR